MSEHKFPTEVIDLPSQGKVYPKDSPLADGKLELKYMTTKEEDILVLETLSPRVTDNIIQFLNDLKPKEFAGSANFHRIQDNILLRVRAAAAPIVVTDALINLALVK